MAAEGSPGRPPAGRTPAERRKQLRARNWALLAALVAFALLVYAVSIVRIGGG